MNSETKKEWLQIAHRLAKDAFFLYMGGGIGFLLAETVLPGIFSQRVDFFFFYVGFLILLGGVIFFGWMSGEDRQQERAKSRVKKSGWNIWMRLFGAGVGILFFVPIARNVSAAFLPFLGVGVAVVCVALVENFFEKEE